MKIQRFSGQDVQEALRHARQALGPEAVILQTRRVPETGLKKLLGRPRVEVLAAVDTAELANQRAAKNASSAGSPTGGAALSPPSPLRRAPRTADITGPPSGRAGGAGAPANREPAGASASFEKEELLLELATVRGELANL